MATDPLADVQLSDDEQKILTSDEGEDVPAAEPADNETPPAPAPNRDTETGRFAKQEEKAEEKPEEAPKEDEQRHVPLAALKEERERRQDLQRQLEETRTNQTRLAERLQVIQERLTKPVEQPKPLDIKEQPLEVLQSVADRVSGIERQQQQVEQFNQFRGHVADQEQAFRSQAPDYDNALAFARESRLGELKTMGLNDAQARQQLALDEFNFSAVAIKNGRNPAQALYEFAGQRGYKKAQPAQEKPVQSQAQPSAQEKLETIAKGQQAAKSVGSAGGAAGGVPLSIENLLEMTPEQIGNLSEDQFRRLMGG